MNQNRPSILLLLIGAVLLLAACGASAPPAAVSPEAAGLAWRERPIAPGATDWRQAEAYFGEQFWPAWDDADRAAAGVRTERGHRLTIGTGVFETRMVAIPILNLDLYLLARNGRLNKVHLGRFTTYSPDLGLLSVADQAAWAFDDGRTSTVVYGGADLRSAYAADAVYAPYALDGKLIVVARRGEQYIVVYDGQQVGPTFDAITIAYCCEPAMYTARGGAGRYTFWGERRGVRYAVQISKK
ncbi:MAG: hypothetical protein BWY52_01426 [Chloroflexi bacterium ADurb.Bin325]|nr:MAG: hypothetical protein BWY52_01426 [Chloroflexi bacterium ADurb.Bin325]